ncbi:MAG TPA: zf-HC2 domain-containing protein [Candidatus Polarisedimenticolaceae bacterium]|nr:zf-HC2 domain-containing protein [Candidatus Polarisedimenticolaceae bacterium]
MSRFDCDAFERQLEALLDGRSSAAARARAVRHLRVCGDCAELMRLATMPPPGPVDLVDGVMARTAGSACAPVRRRLCALVDGELDPLQAEQARSHVDSCADCATLLAVLGALPAALVLLREMALDDRFTADVLARIRSLPSKAPGRTPSWLRRAVQLLERPRFPLEAAYVMTTLVVLFAGIPSAPIAGVSRRAFEIASADLPAGIEQSVVGVGDRVGGSAKQTWDSASEQVSRDARRRADAVAELSSVLASDIRTGIGTLWERIASVEGEQDDRLSPAENDGRTGDGR